MERAFRESTSASQILESIDYDSLFFSDHATGLWDLSSPARDQTHAPCIRIAKS